MTDNKAATKELAERHIKAVAAWQEAIIAEKQAEQALGEARGKARRALMAMQESQKAFGLVTGCMDRLTMVEAVTPPPLNIVVESMQPGGRVNDCHKTHIWPWHYQRGRRQMAQGVAVLTLPARVAHLFRLE